MTTGQSTRVDHDLLKKSRLVDICDLHRSADTRRDLDLILTERPDWVVYRLIQCMYRNQIPYSCRGSACNGNFDFLMLQLEAAAHSANEHVRWTTFASVSRFLLDQVQRERNDRGLDRSRRISKDPVKSPIDDKQLQTLLDWFDAQIKSIDIELPAHAAAAADMAIRRRYAIPRSAATRKVYPREEVEPLEKHLLLGLSKITSLLVNSEIEAVDIDNSVSALDIGKQRFSQYDPLWSPGKSFVFKRPCCGDESVWISTFLPMRLISFLEWISQLCGQLLNKCSKGLLGKRDEFFAEISDWTVTGLKHREQIYSMAISSQLDDDVKNVANEKLRIALSSSVNPLIEVCKFHKVGQLSARFLEIASISGIDALPDPALEYARKCKAYALMMGCRVHPVFLDVDLLGILEGRRKKTNSRSASISGDPTASIPEGFMPEPAPAIPDDSASCVPGAIGGARNGAHETAVLAPDGSLVSNVVELARVRPNEDTENRVKRVNLVIGTKFKKKHSLAKRVNTCLRKLVEVCSRQMNKRDPDRMAEVLDDAVELALKYRVPGCIAALAAFFEDAKKPVILDHFRKPRVISGFAETLLLAMGQPYLQDQRTMQKWQRALWNLYETSTLAQKEDLNNNQRLLIYAATSHVTAGSLRGVSPRYANQLV